jgi:hypothetical protein
MRYPSNFMDLPHTNLITAATLSRSQVFRIIFELATQVYRLDSQVRNLINEVSQSYSLVFYIFLLCSVWKYQCGTIGHRFGSIILGSRNQSLLCFAIIIWQNRFPSGIGCATTTTGRCCNHKSNSKVKNTDALGGLCGCATPIFERNEADSSTWPWSVFSLFSLSLLFLTVVFQRIESNFYNNTLKMV